jgi:hypothetical protein
MTGIFTGSALPGLVFTFFSSRQGSLAAVSSIWGGFGVAVIVWITIAKRLGGEISITSVGALDPCLYGCVAGIGASTVITVVISIFRNADYQWETLKALRVTDEDGQERDVALNDPAYNAEKLRKAAYWARGITAFLFLALFIIWPLSMYGSGYIFSRTFFRGWVIVSLLWAFGAIFAVSILPLVEGRRTILGLIFDLVDRKTVLKRDGRETSTDAEITEDGSEKDLPVSR